MKPQTIPSKKLKAFLDATKRDSRLVGVLERHLMTRPAEARRRDIIHPSDLVKSEFCALHSYHSLRGNHVDTQDKPSLRLQSIFDEGHTIHKKWQNWIAEMGNLYGLWKQKDGSFTWGYSGTEYREVPVSSAKHRIAGHSDGWVKNLGEDFLIEIKSVGAGTFRFEAPSLLSQAGGDVEAAWRAIRQPFRSHMLQGQVYLHLCHLMVEEGILESAPNEIVFIYELKANQEYKEFVVAYDPEYVKDLFDLALDIAWAVDNNQPPACNIDPVNGCKRCATLRTADGE